MSSVLGKIIAERVAFPGKKWYTIPQHLILFQGASDA